MPWTKLTDTFHNDPRLLNASDGAVVLYTRGLSHCGQMLSDGYIDPTVALALMPGRSKNAVSKLVDELVAAGLWECDDRGGWQHVGYLDEQSSREDVEERRRADKARQRKHRDKKKAERHASSATRDTGVAGDA